MHRAVVGNHHLLEESPEHLTQAVDCLVAMKLPLPLELRQQVGGPLDGTSNELREEAYEGEEGEQVARGTYLSAVDIDGVAQRLEGVEADAHGQDHLQGAGRQLPAEEREGIDEAVDEEVVVLEGAQYGQVEGDVERGDEACPATGGEPFAIAAHLTDGQAAEVAQCDGDYHEKQEAPVPPAVEKKAGGDD